VRSGKISHSVKLVAIGGNMKELLYIFFFVIFMGYFIWQSRKMLKKLIGGDDDDWRPTNE
jgi:hypothetical protein